MKLKLLGIALAIMITATGCGVLDNVNQSVSFANETTQFMDSLNDFRADMNGLAEGALNDLDARTDLKNRLMELKEQILSYKDIAVPDYAKDLHASIVEYNDKLQQGLDQALTNIEQGRDAFASTGIPETVNKINDLLSQLNAIIPNG